MDSYEGPLGSRTCSVTTRNATIDQLKKKAIDAPTPGDKAYACYFTTKHNKKISNAVWMSDRSKQRGLRGRDPLQGDNYAVISDACESYKQKLLPGRPLCSSRL